MSSAIHDDELSMSLPQTDRSTRQRPSIGPIKSPAIRNPINTQQAESPGTARAMNRLHQYSFVRNIGEGSFGKVKLARHKVTGQEVAMKTINRRKLISRDMQGRVEREIQYLQLLRHPHIIKLYTVITTKTDIYMVLEYVPMELFDYIVKHGRLNEEKARRLFQQIICAVEYCHRHKIVHRDLKPENLLLDENFNVKIADFGLSNIMTDGNFLKTSCGSPNYAAPEVIGGKLYAGPEVDVWSCGVILYVFLVGRLPFDDEFIPALFKKIQAGTFHIPSSTPSGAVNLIKRCLQVHPVQRITIPEIRQDEWFLKNLPAYLVEPVEEFLDTGVDSAKAIDPTQLAPGKSTEEVEKMHNDVVKKLGRTMGYAKEDVKDALGKDEPSAIKDAYLIVRENQLMQETPQYQVKVDDPLKNFLATSPPVESNYPDMMLGSPIHRRMADDIKPLTPSRGEQSRQSRTLSETPSLQREEDKPRVSSVRVLNTSLPHIHDELMQLREKAKTRGLDPDTILDPSQAHEADDQTTAIPEEVTDDKGNTIYRSKEEQDATSKALKPHSRSVIDINELRTPKPEKMTAVTQESKAGSGKPRQRKWQFGIRSRNQPYEAMRSLFGALKQQGAEWEIVPATKSEGNQEHEEDGLPPLPPDLAPGEQHARLQRKYSDIPSDYYIPRDPWNIRARILKRGMLMPGEEPSISANSSAVSLPTEARNQIKKHLEHFGGYVSEELSTIMGQSSGPPSKTKSLSTHSSDPSRPGTGMDDYEHGHDAFAGPGKPPSRADSLNPFHKKKASEDIGVWVFIDVQLYAIEPNVFVVDFKCDGYQNVVLHDPKKERERAKSPTNSRPSAATTPGASRPTSGVGGAAIEVEADPESSPDEKRYWRPVSNRYRNVEKETTSPYPFLDVASDLVAQLASQPAG